MRLNFYSRRRRFNKSLLGSHKNSLTLTKKPKTCDLSSYACWVAVVATLYATYPRAFRLRNRKGLRHSMLALTPHSGDCSGASLEMPSEAFLHTKTRSFSVWLELRSPLLLPFESKSQLLSPYKKAFTLFTSKTATLIANSTPV